MPHTNRRVFIRQYREGMPALEDFGIEDVTIADVPAGHAVVRVDTLSMDAWIRTTLTPGSFHETADLGSTIRALGVGQVVESADPALAVGDGPEACEEEAPQRGDLGQEIVGEKSGLDISRPSH